MKGDGVLNLLIFQAFQDVRMASSLVRSTTEKPWNFNISRFLFLKYNEYNEDFDNVITMEEPRLVIK